MPLDADVQRFLAQEADLQLPPLHTLSPTAARQQEQRLRPPNLRPQPLDAVVNRTVPGPGGELPLRLYCPVDPATTRQTFPVLVFFHGGGWVLGDLESMDAVCRLLARQAQCIIASVAYRLAPEHPFPAAVEDAFAATQWVANQCASFAGDSTRLAVGGDSAGGNLAAAVTLMARDRNGPNIAWQLLLYPALQWNAKTLSYREFGSGACGLSQAEMDWFWGHYLTAPESQGRQPLASPLLAKDLSNLPPAHIITAEYDVLRDEGEAYAARLEVAGVPVLLQRYSGQIHGFIGMPTKLKAAKRAIAAIAEQLKQALS